MKPLMNTKEVSQYIGINEKKIYNLIVAKACHQGYGQMAFSAPAGGPVAGAAHRELSLG